VAFAEARSAFARLEREGALSESDLASVRRDFLQDWSSYLKVRVLRRVYERAGELTEKYPLRGFDALHVASFLEVADQAGEEIVRFSAFDERLNAAAEAEGPSSTV
jgi:predicted nucleic acid-binding protein